MAVRCASFLRLTPADNHMASPQEIRQLRLANDYREMCNVRGPMIAWRATRGVPPHVEAYELTVEVRSITGSGPSYRQRHLLTLELPASYPDAAPSMRMLTSPPPFHPNWWPDGRWCHGSWDFSEGLGHYTVRMIRALRFDPEITNPNSPANGPANAWYQSQARSGLFPSDSQPLPDPTTSSRFVVRDDAVPTRTAPRRTFRMNE